MYLTILRTGSTFVFAHVMTVDTAINVFGLSAKSALLSCNTKKYGSDACRLRLSCFLTIDSPAGFFRVLCNIIDDHIAFHKGLFQWRQGWILYKNKIIIHPPIKWTLTSTMSLTYFGLTGASSGITNALLSSSFVSTRPKAWDRLMHNLLLL